MSLSIRIADPRISGIANMALGGWLFLSAFLWVHSDTQFTNAWLAGLVVAVSAGAGMRFPAYGFACSVAGAWLFFSVWLMATPSPATVWNHLLTGAAIFVVSLMPGLAGRPVERRAAV